MPERKIRDRTQNTTSGWHGLTLWRDSVERDHDQKSPFCGGPADGALAAFPVRHLAPHTAHRTLHTAHPHITPSLAPEFFLLGVAPRQPGPSTDPPEDRPRGTDTGGSDFSPPYPP